MTGRTDEEPDEARATSRLDSRHGNRHDASRSRERMPAPAPSPAQSPVAWGSRYRPETLRMIRRMQSTLRDGATEAGLHLACPLPRCRRAKRCVGSHPFDEIGTTHRKTFPPCVADDRKQGLMLAGAERVQARIDATLLAAGWDAAAIEALRDEESDRLWSDEPHPEDPPAVSGPRAVSRASRKGR